MGRKGRQNMQLAVVMGHHDVVVHVLVPAGVATKGKGGGERTGRWVCPNGSYRGVLLSVHGEKLMPCRLGEEKGRLCNRPYLGVWIASLSHPCYRRGEKKNNTRRGKRVDIHRLLSQVIVTDATKKEGREKREKEKKSAMALAFSP